MNGSRPAQHLLSVRAASYRVADDPGDTLCSAADFIVREVRIALGRGDVSMAKQPADGEEAETAHHGVQRERV